MGFCVNRTIIGEGVAFTEITDKKFKASRLSVRFITPLCAENASKNALCVGILSSSNEKYPTPSSFSRCLNKLYGADLSADATKLGDCQILILTADFIDDDYTFDNEQLTSAISKLMADCIFKPALNGEAFEKSVFAIRKQNLLDDIAAEINNKMGYDAIRAALTIYSGEPCAMTVNGTAEAVEAITPESCYAAYKKLLETAKIEITYVGRGSKNCCGLFADAFSKINRAPFEPGFYSPSPVKAQPAEVCEKMDVLQAKLVMCFKSPSDDYYALSLANMLFGGTCFSKLFTNVREKLSLCYYCSSSFNEQKGTLCVFSGVDAENIEKARNEIINQLELLRSGDFTSEDIEKALLTVNNNLLGESDCTGSLSSAYFYRFFRGQLIDAKDIIAAFHAVTRERIRDAANSLVLDTIYVMEATDGSDN